MNKSPKFWVIDESKWVPYFQGYDKEMGPDPALTGYYLITESVCHVTEHDNGEKTSYTTRELRIAHFQDYGECYGWDMCEDSIIAWYPLVIHGPLEK